MIPWGHHISMLYVILQYKSIGKYSSQGGGHRGLTGLICMAKNANSYREVIKSGGQGPLFPTPMLHTINSLCICFINQCISLSSGFEPRDCVHVGTHD